MVNNLLLKKEMKKIISVGVFKLLNRVSESMIKAYGAVFIYINYGQLLHVFLYLIIYSMMQILTNLLCSKLFSKKTKLSLILRIIPF